MADLPDSRLGYQQPSFTNTGVDYFGPLLVRNGRKNEKRYAALFTCLTTWAVFIEIAHSLDTDPYLMAMRRMMARRGRLAHIWSNNGTNFVGAEKELREAMRRLDSERISNQLSVDGIQWHFNPPSSSCTSVVRGSVLFSLSKELLKQWWENSASTMRPYSPLWPKWSHY